MYLLDDPLSAVDAHVGLHLFNECLGPKGQLGQRNATRILVTHQVHFLKEADWVVIMRDGKIEVQGTSSDIQNSGVDFSTLLSSLDEENEEIDLTMEQETSLGKRSRNESMSSAKSANEANHSVDDAADDKMHDLEDSSKGKVKGSLLMHYFNSAEKPVAFCVLIVLFLLAQALASGADYWVANWYVLSTSPSLQCNPFYLFIFTTNCRTQIEEQRTYYTQQSEHVAFAKIIVQTDSSNSSIGVSADDGESLPSTKTCAWIHGSILAALLVIALIRCVEHFHKFETPVNTVIPFSDHFHSFDCAWPPPKSFMTACSRASFPRRCDFSTQIHRDAY